MEQPAGHRSPRVLIIDDNPDDRMLIERELRQSLPQFELLEVRTLEELEQTLRLPFDAAITDYQLRFATGTEVFRKIRATHPDVPVIMFTASGSEEIAAEALKEGLADYITKTPRHYPRIPVALQNAIERARHRIESRQAQEALKEADRRKDEFLAMLAHELRNPLAPIRNATELLALMRINDARVQQVLEIVRRQVGQMTHLVDDLLDVSRITRGHIELAREPVELMSLVKEAVEVVEPLVRERGHRVKVVTTGRAAYVHGDRLRLVQCVTNLLVNAVKYTDPGGQIRVALEHEGDSATVAVTDDGSGIPPDLLPHVFDLFVQGRRTPDRAAGGLGIGLSVAKRLVEMHDGRITAQSDGVGRGATFTIRLPLSRTPVAALPEDSLVRSPPRRILVVDDNADAADTLARIIREGHDLSADQPG
jgi:signal transduction histidine kinase